MVTPTTNPPVRAFTACALVTTALLLRRELRLRDDNVDRRLRFADGATGTVYRETVRRAAPTRDPALLVVEFRLRLLDGRPRLHALFRVESLLNTFLFAGFPGFRRKLWCTDEGRGYRGVYEWDGADRAAAYATTLSGLLRPVCVPGSVRFHVEPGVRLEEVLRDPTVLAADDASADVWWRLDGEVAA